MARSENLFTIAMDEKRIRWFEKWFNEDYLKLYAHRNEEEATEQVDFLLSHLEIAQGAKVLDLGCGMGRHAFAFARRGFDVTGIDLSPLLIQQAKVALQKEPELRCRLHFMEANLFALPPLGKFDVVTNLFTSFGYFEKDEKNAALFRVAAEHLNPEGVFFLDYLHPGQVRRSLIPHEQKEIEGGHVDIFKTITNNRVVKTIQFYRPERTYSEKVKLYDRSEVEKMLEQQHFEVVDVWNDFKGGAWKEDGDRQLFYSKLKRVSR